MDAGVVASHPLDTSRIIDAEGNLRPRLLTEALDHAVATWPDRVCVDFLGREWTYGQIGELVDRVATGLQAAGLGKGDRFGLCLPNTPYSVVLYFAVLRAGATVVNLNPLYTHDEVEFLITDSGAKMIAVPDLEVIHGKVAAAWGAQDEAGKVWLEKVVLCPMADVLPLAQSLSPRLRRMEDRLAHLTAEMRAAGTRDNQELLAELTELAAELEADAAASLYRFGASRAYDGIVEERLQALAEEPVPGHDTLAAFLQRRVAPAMRTCRSVEERQANLSRKLTRATTLLRSWVDIEVEKQNRDLLASMNNRARLQLRLQQTVEGLSVAAVSYYVVGLIGYLAKGTTVFGLEFKPELVTAASVPLVVVAMWLFVRRIRRSHADDGQK